MKIIASIVFLFGLQALAAPQMIVAPPNGHVKLAWDYDTNQLSTNLFFNIYETTNLTIPFANWNLLTNVVGTNLSATMDVTPGAHFFVATASNFWMETSITSNLTSTPPLPQSINDSLRIEKAP